MTSLIICNGEPPLRSVARQFARKADLIVAADGGANVARRYGIRPHVIIGDLDSMTSQTRRFFTSGPLGGGLKSRSEAQGVHLPRPTRLASGPSVSTARRGLSDSPERKGRGYVRIIRVKRQDSTDLEKALDYLVKQKVQEVVIIGAAGRRLDFTLGNLSVVWNYAKRMAVSFVGDEWTAVPVGRERIVRALRGTLASLVPFGDCSGVTLKGLRYPLTNARMRVGEIGVSNVVEKSPFTVRVRKGNMLLILLDQPRARRNRR